MSEQCAALIMAGGRSSRMRRGGSPLHKALRTVAEIPLIEWNLSALLHDSFREVHLALSAEEPELATWASTTGAALTRSAGADWNVIVERTPLGTAGALRLLPKSVRNVLVVNVDNLTDLPLADLAAHHLRVGAAATVATHRETFVMPFGQLTLAEGQVTAYHEKPSLPVQVSSGTTVFARQAIDLICDERATHIPDLVTRLIADGHRVAAFEHRSRWIDVNDEQALARAEAMLRDPDQPWPGMRKRSVTHA